jgi:hypothetical protein
MDKQKFDGPSFVNPSNTSYSLNNAGSYQTPQMSSNNMNKEASSSTSQANLKTKNSMTNLNNKKGPRGKIRFSFYRMGR